MTYRIKEVAEMVGISVRTLHHYDHIGLLHPESISQAGYRQYSEEDLERLQQILFFKEVGFKLDKIQIMLDHPDFDRKKALLEHKYVLEKKQLRLQQMIATVEETIETIEGGTKMDGERLFAGFSMKEIEEHQKRYAKEAEEKYGDTYKESKKKTGTYSKAQWQEILKESDTIYRKLASLMDRPVDDEAVQSAIHDWRMHITKYYYECTLEIFRGLGEMYVSDERFTKNIEKFGEGLALYMSKAMDEYCDSYS